MQFLTLAFISVWVLVTGYVVFLSRRQSSLELELAVLEESIPENQTRD